MGLREAIIREFDRAAADSRWREIGVVWNERSRHDWIGRLTVTYRAAAVAPGAPCCTMEGTAMIDAFAGMVAVNVECIAAGGPDFAPIRLVEFEQWPADAVSETTVAKWLRAVLDAFRGQAAGFRITDKWPFQRSE